MAHAYTPGLLVTPRMRHRVRRVLPISGDVLVAQGQHVQAEDIVARTFMPGDVIPVNLANQLSLSPDEVPNSLLKKPGEAVTKGEPLARTKGLFGLFKSEYASPATGTVESVSEVTGQLMLRGEPIPVQVRGYLTGEVVEVLPGEGVVIEAEAAFIQGIFGIGGEAFGMLHRVCSSPEEDLTAERITEECCGKVVIGGRRIHQDAVQKAVKLGVSAVVAGGIDDADLKAMLGYDLGVAITGSETIGTTVIITEGFGDIAMAEATFKLFGRFEGAAAAVNGATQIRAGVMRPEIVIPLVAEAPSGEAMIAHGGGVLSEGSRVRVIRDPYFGMRGQVSSLPHEPQLLATGSRARVLEVTFEDGRRVVVPRANVEITA
jgi:hypothetical protein